MKFYTCSCCILVAKPGGPTFSCGNSLRSSLGAGWADLASNELTGQNGQTNSHGPRPILCRFDRSVASFLSGSLGAGSADVGAHAPAPSLSLLLSCSTVRFIFQLLHQVLAKTNPAFFFWIEIENRSLESPWPPGPSPHAWPWERRTDVNFNYTWRPRIIPTVAS